MSPEQALNNVAAAAAMALLNAPDRNLVNASLEVLRLMIEAQKQPSPAAPAEPAKA